MTRWESTSIAYTKARGGGEENWEHLLKNHLSQLLFFITVAKMFAYITWVVSVPKICIHPNPRPTRFISKWGDNMCPPRRCSIGSVHSWMHGMCCRGRPRWPRDTPLLPHRRLSGLPTGSSRTCSMIPHPAVELGSPSWSNPPLCNTVFTNLPIHSIDKVFHFQLY